MSTEQQIIGVLGGIYRWVTEFVEANKQYVDITTDDNRALKIMGLINFFNDKKCSMDTVVDYMIEQEIIKEVNQEN